MENLTAEAPPANRLPLFALLAANATSQVGNMMTTVAIPWFILQTTGSPLQVGISSFVATVPLFIAAFISGGLVDRFSPKRMSIISDILSGITVAAIPLLFGMNALTYPMLLALVFVGAILDTPGNTARQSLLPDLIKRAQIKPERANAAYDAIYRFSILFGPLLGGLLTARFSAPDVLWIDAITFVVSALLITAYAPRVLPKPSNNTQERAIANLTAGFQFLRGDSVLMGLLIILSWVDLIANALLVTVVPVYAQRVFGSAADFGGMLSAFGGGMLIGTILYGMYGHRLPRYRTLILGLLGASLPSLLLITLPSLPVTLLVLAVMGISLAPVSTLSINVFQERTPAHLRGRVFGTRMALQTVSIPVGMLITGALLEGLGLVPSLAVLTITYSLVAVVALLLPGLRRLAERPPALAHPSAGQSESALPPQ